MDNLQKRVCDYIRDYMNADFEVNPDHFLTADLGIDSDQGIYFIEDFAKEFGTDFSRMSIANHFSNRWFPIEFVDFFRNFKGSKKPSRSKIVDLRVSEMILAVEKGEWSDAILERDVSTGKSVPTS